MGTAWQARQMCAWSPQPLRRPPGGRAEPLATGAARGGGCVADLACLTCQQLAVWCAGHARTDRAMTFLCIDTDCSIWF